MRFGLISNSAQVNGIHLYQPVGWDYRTVNSTATQDYALTQSLKQGSFVAITLAWNRFVELKDANKNAQYDLGRSFAIAA